MEPNSIHELLRKLSKSATKSGNLTESSGWQATSLETQKALSLFAGGSKTKAWSLMSVWSHTRSQEGVAIDLYSDDSLVLDWHVELDFINDSLTFDQDKPLVTRSKMTDFGESQIFWDQIDQESDGGLDQWVRWSLADTNTPSENLWTYPGVGMKWREARADKRAARRDPVGRACQIMEQLQPGELALWDLDEFFLPSKVPSIEKVDEALCALFAEADPRVTIEVFIDECEDCEHRNIRGCWRFEPPRIYAYTNWALIGRTLTGTTTVEPIAEPTIFPRLVETSNSVVRSVNRHICWSEEEVTYRTVWSREATQH